MNEVRHFVGGALGTNAYWVQGETDGQPSAVLFDAPEGVAEWAREQGLPVAALVLTHGHFDHIEDAARVRREFGCPVYCHAADQPMVMERGYFERIGIPIRIEPTEVDHRLEEGVALEVAGRVFRVLHVPGHSPGSVCLYDAAAGVLIGGDVLFAGGIGRWDFPGGGLEMLVDGIRAKLFTLPDTTIVYPGHGPATTIGGERASNPFVGGGEG